MTLKEKLLEVFTEEEVNDLVLNEGVSLDMEVQNTLIDTHEAWSILFEEGYRNICDLFGHQWDSVYQLRGSGMRRCKICLKVQYMKFYKWKD